MGEIDVRYSRVEGGKRRWSHVPRGFKVSPRRFSVPKLKLRRRLLQRLITLLRRWNASFINSIRKGFCVIGIRKYDGRSCNSPLIVRDRIAEGNYDYRLRSFARSNSFYSEAIADCLEFIKRSSSSSVNNQR